MEIAVIILAFFGGVYLKGKEVENKTPVVAPASFEVEVLKECDASQWTVNRSRKEFEFACGGGDEAGN